MAGRERQRALTAAGCAAVLVLLAGCGAIDQLTAATAPSATVPPAPRPSPAPMVAPLPSTTASTPAPTAATPAVTMPQHPAPLPTPSPLPPRLRFATTIHTLADGRHFVLHRSTTADTPRPLVVVLHPAWLLPRWIEATSGFTEYADLHGFDVVYGAGVKSVWNAGGCCGLSQADDVLYLQQILEAVAVATPVDPRRVYLVGMSNGGMMALRAACELPGVFAAVGVVAGALLTDVDCAQTRIHAYVIHGDADEVVPAAGGSGVDGYDFLPVADTVARVGAGSIIETHVWPGGHDYPTWATDELWTWLAQWSLPAAPRDGEP